MAPNFSAYPFQRLRKLSRSQALLESTLARWIAARPGGARVAKLVAARGRHRDVAPAIDAPVHIVVVAPSAFDPFAARCEVRVAGAAIEARGSSVAVRAIAQRLLGGPDELAAPRPLTIAERSIWSLVVATALEDLGVAGEVWPRLDDDDGISSSSEAPTRVGKPSKGRTRRGQRGDERDARNDKREVDNRDVDKGEVDKRSGGRDDMRIVELAVTVRDHPRGDLSLAVQIYVPADLALRVPPSRAVPAWFETTQLDVPIVLGRCALDAGALDRLVVRSVITLDRPGQVAELDLLGGSVGVRATAGTLEAEVVTGYVPRDMALPDDAHVELTVALGTTKLSLRQISELAIGQIVQLGRPLAGPFELRAAGRVLGRGELVDVDGELAVRIVSLGD